MITKEKYQKELVRMWDSLRSDIFKGRTSCVGVRCDKCPLKGTSVDGTCTNYGAFEQIECVEKWSKEHPEKVRKDGFFNSFDDVMSLFAFGKIDSSDLISIERWYSDSTMYRWKVTYFGFEK